MKEKNVLLFVDDDESTLSEVSNTFIDEPYKVLLATGAQKALEMMTQNKVSVIVSDLTMPGMNGMKLLDIVKEKYPSTIRMMVSGHANITNLLKAINENIIYRFITKPFNNTEELKSIVRQGMEYYNLRRERDMLIMQVGQYRRQAEQENK